MDREGPQARFPSSSTPERRAVGRPYYRGYQELMTSARDDHVNLQHFNSIILILVLTIFASKRPHTPLVIAALHAVSYNVALLVSHLILAGNLRQISRKSSPEVLSLSLHTYAFLVLHLDIHLALN